MQKIMGHYDILFASQKSKTSRYPDAYDDPYESAYCDSGLLTVEQEGFLESFNISEQEVTAELGEEGKIHFALQLEILMKQVNAGEGDTIEDEFGMTTVYSVSDENGILCLIIAGNSAYMHYQYLDDVVQVQLIETIAPQTEKKVFVPSPPYEKKPGDYVFESMILSGDDQLSYTVNRGRNQYGYILGIGSNGAYTLKLKRALHMAIKVNNVFGRNFTDPFTAEQLPDPKFDNHTLEEFAKYQALKNLKDQSGNVGPVTLKSLDHDARLYEVMNKSGQQDPAEKDRLSGNAANNKNVYQFGQVGNYTFNMSTSAGRQMYVATQNAIKYGNEYIPSKDKLNEQYIQSVGSDQLLKDSDNALRKANMVLLRINISLANPDLNAEIKAMLTAKKQILSGAVEHMTTLLNSDDREVSDAKEEQLENAKQKEAEASKALILPTLPVTSGGEVVKQAARTAAAEAGGTAAVETGGVVVSGAVVVAVAVCAVAIVAVACLYHMLTAGGLVKLKGLIDELTKTADDVLMFVDSPAALPKAPVAKPIDKPENKPEEKPEPKEKPKPVVPPPPTDDKKDDCEPEPLGYHRGGDAYHNQLSDTIPPNKIHGTDWLLKGKAFDSYSPKEELWEVKTAQYSTYKPFVKQMELNKIISDVKVEKPIAEGCGFHYVLGVTDVELLDALEIHPDMILLNIDIRLIF